MKTAQKNIFFDMFSEFSVLEIDENSTEIRVNAYGNVPTHVDLEDVVADLGLVNLISYLPVNQTLCSIDELPSFRALGVIKALAVETDQMCESSEHHQSDGFEFLRHVETLTVAMRRPKDGIKQLDSGPFVQALLSYVNSDVDLSFVLFDSQSKGAKSQSRRIHSTVQADIDVINDVFLGFPNYKGCSHQRRFPRFQ